MGQAERVVVAGASLAGVRTAQALRDKGFHGELVLVGAEQHLPYDRPPLSKGLLGGRLSEADVKVLASDELAQLELDLRLGRRAERVDPSWRKVTLDDGHAVTYGKLVIATGASPRMPDNWRGLRGVHTLRTIDDCLSLKDDLARSARVVVVGGGFIGCEVASTARGLGCDVALVEPLVAPMARVLGPDLALACAPLHADAGVRLFCQQAVDEILGENRVERVRLTNGELLDCDVLVVGIGTRPETEWLAGSGITVSDGVVCDQRCAASVPDVFAVGDVARWFNPLFGEHMRVEHWTNASEQASFVAGAVLGVPRPEAFSPVPYVWSEQHGVKLEFAGVRRPTDQVRIVEGSIADRTLLAHFERDGILVGAVAVNASRSLLKVRRLLADRARPDRSLDVLTGSAS